jgi:hypothetical protein
MFALSSIASTVTKSFVAPSLKGLRRLAFSSAPKYLEYGATVVVEERVK